MLAEAKKKADDIINSAMIEAENHREKQKEVLAEESASGPVRAAPFDGQGRGGKTGREVEGRRRQGCRKPGEGCHCRGEGTSRENPEGCGRPCIVEQGKDRRGKQEGPCRSAGRRKGQGRQAHQGSREPGGGDQDQVNGGKPQGAGKNARRSEVEGRRVPEENHG